ncbi:MAG: OsmC family protein [Desulfuromusa sp.]|nr:OsmC family protein [Desulfuromusa sp.]
MTSKLTVIFITVLLSSIASTAMSDTSDNHDSTTSVIKGVNLAKFNAGIEDIRANPAHGRVEFRATGESEEMLYHSTARIGPFMAAGQEMGKTRQYVLHLGLPVELQGDVEQPVDRIEPVELALAGLSDCIIATIAMHALLNGINIDSISTTIKAPLNLQVLLGIDGLDKRDQIYGNIAINVEIEGPNLTEKQRLFLSQQAKRSPVFNLIALAQKMDTTLTIRK